MQKAAVALGRVAKWAGKTKPVANMVTVPAERLLCLNETPAAEPKLAEQQVLLIVMKS